MTRKFASKSAIYLSVFLMTSLLVLVLLEADSRLSFDIPIKVTDDTWDHKNPDIAISGAGTTAKVFIVYEDYESFSTPHIFFKRSVNGGASFPYNVDLFPYTTTGDKIWNPSMDNMGDKIAVVFLDNHFKELFPAEAVVTAALSDDGGDTWVISYITDTETPDPSITDPYVDIDPDGNIFVVWKQDGDATIAYSDDFGNTWYPPQKVLGWDNPDDPNGEQKIPTVACDGSHVVVAVEGLPTFKPVAYYTSAGMPSMGTFSFGTWTRMTYYEYTNFNSESRRPIVVTDGSAFHMICWDFQSDKNKAYEAEDSLANDRASIAYTKSTDGGATFSIAGKKSVYVNKTTTPLAWHSAGAIHALSGKVYITWVDYTQGSPNKGAVWVTSTTDGLTWSEQDRVTSYTTSRVVKDDPQVTADTNGDALVAWVSKGDFSSPGNINFGRSNPNNIPVGVTGLLWSADPDLPETRGTVTWNINSEPDFQEYRMYLGNTPGFTPGSYAFNTTDQGLDIYDFTDLEPNTQYYLVIGVMDTAGSIGYSAELPFKTKPINMPPHLKPGWNFSLVYMLEDLPVLNAINLTWLFENGYILDDHYNDHYEVFYEIEPFANNSYVSALITNKGDINNTYWIVDFRPYPDKVNQVPFDIQWFNLTISDTGRDGSFGNPDDKKMIVRIGVRMNSTNDLPTWDKFIDLSSNAVTQMTQTQTVLDLTTAAVGAIEDLPYRFAIRGDDVDANDFLFFSCSDDRISADPDTMEFKRKWNFEFIPTNDDVPTVNFTITMDDHVGGMRNLTVVLPVQAVNDPPVIVTIDEKPFKPGKYNFQMMEEMTFEFNVTAYDQDPGDVIKLMAMGSGYVDRVTFTKRNTTDLSWTVKVKSLNDDPQTGAIIFNLRLEDRLQSHVEVPIEILVINTPDPPSFRPTPYDVTFIHDMVDTYEWGGVTKPGGDAIRGEWGEVIRFTAFARDSDNEALNYTWKFTNTLDTDRTKVMTYYGLQVDVPFFPFDGKLYHLASDGRFAPAGDEDFSVELIVTDNVFPAISKAFSIRLYGDDGDNDNDGLPDVRESWFYRELLKSNEVTEFNHKAPVDKDSFVYDEWKSKYRHNIHYQYYGLLTDDVKGNLLLLLDTQDDPDREGEPNINEIGFGIPLYDTEIRNPYSLNMDFLDPFNPGSYPGTKWVPPPPPFKEEAAKIPGWAYLLIGSILFIVIIIGGGIFGILRWNKRKEEQEDAEIDRRVQEAERRSKEINTLYGAKYSAGEVIGPDQSTLDDLKLDLGGAVYHEEGSGGIVDETGHKKKGDKTGPAWQTTGGGGPAFEKTATKLEFGESLQLEAIGHEADTGEMDHSGIDEEGIEDSFEEIMDAADEYNADQMSKAGGGVQIGAMTLEQLQQQKAQSGFGPRLAPPGQEAPHPMPMPPGQAPPGMPPRPQQKKNV
jgi:hypothetical protein